MGIWQPSASLQQRVLELEQLLSARNQEARPVVAHQPDASAFRPKAPPLFRAQMGTQMSDQDWRKLQALAGPPPGRVGAGVQRIAAERGQPTAAENLYAEMEREAIEPGTLDLVPSPTDVLVQQMNEVQDPVQKILLAQLAQNQTLLQKLVSPPSYQRSGAERPVVRRLGQRLRRVIHRRERVHGPRGLSSHSPGFAKSLRGNEAECPSRTRFASKPGGLLVDDEICRKKDVFGRSPPAGAVCRDAGGSLVGGLHQPERRARGAHLQDALFCRAKRPGRRQNSTGVVALRVERPPDTSVHDCEETPIPATICGALQPHMGVGQSCLLEGPRLHGVPITCCEQNAEAAASGRSRCRQTQSETQEASKERKRGVERKDRPVGIRHRRPRDVVPSRSGVQCYESPTALSEPKHSGSLSSSLDQMGCGLGSSSDGCLDPPDVSTNNLVFSMINLVQTACRGLKGSPTAVGHFTRVSLAYDPACTGESPPGDLWPTPPPGGVGWEAND